MFIDDDKASTIILKKMIQQMNITDEVIIKNDGASALSYLKGEETEGKPPIPDMIFLDLNMPGMGGFEFLEAYSKFPSTLTNRFQPLVVILSAELDPTNFKKAKLYRAIGVSDHLKKPMNQYDVEALLEEYFDFDWGNSTSMAVH